MFVSDVSFYFPDISATFRENETELQRKKAFHFEQSRGWSYQETTKGKSEFPI